MDERHKKLIEAATIVFGKYGVSKTTMNDIAHEAGVARQTLYNAYPSKEAVLRAALRHAADQTIEAVQAKWRHQTELSDKLETFFQLGPLYWYDLTQASPETADLINGINTIANDELIEIAKIWSALFEEVLRQHAEDGSVALEDVPAMAEFIFSSSMHTKMDAPDRKTIVTRLHLLRLAILSLTQRVL